MRNTKTDLSLRWSELPSLTEGNNRTAGDKERINTATLSPLQSSKANSFKCKRWPQPSE